MTQPLANVTRVERLQSFPILTERVEMTGTALAELSVYRAVTMGGDYPAALTDRSFGILKYFSETEADVQYGTVVTEGIEILEVEPGETIALNDPIAVNASGKAVLAVSTNEVIGNARNASAGSTVSVPHFIEVKIDQIVLP